MIPFRSNRYLLPTAPLFKSPVCPAFSSHSLGCPVFCHQTVPPTMKSTKEFPRISAAKVWDLLKRLQDSANKTKKHLYKVKKTTFNCIIIQVFNLGLLPPRPSKRRKNPPPLPKAKLRRFGGPSPRSWRSPIRRACLGSSGRSTLSVPRTKKVIHSLYKHTYFCFGKISPKNIPNSQDASK